MITLFAVTVVKETVTMAAQLLRQHGYQPIHSSRAVDCFAFGPQSAPEIFVCLFERKAQQRTVKSKFITVNKMHCDAVGYVINCFDVFTMLWTSFTCAVVWRTAILE